MPLPAGYFFVPTGKGGEKSIAKILNIMFKKPPLTAKFTLTDMLICLLSDVSTSQAWVGSIVLLLQNALPWVNVQT